MKRPSPQAHALARLQQQAWQTGAIEWEELPSLADSLTRRLVVLGERHRADAEPAPTGWEPTQTASLDALPPSEPFRETLRGLSTREVREPDVFRHFFGAR